MVSTGDMMIFQCDVALRSRSLKEPDWEYKRCTKAKGSICIVVGTQGYGDDKVDCCIYVANNHQVDGLDQSSLNLCDEIYCYKLSW